MKVEGLVFGGSGFMFPAYLGALQGVRDQDIETKNYLGTSGGSIVAAVGACNIDIDDALETSKAFFRNFKLPPAMRMLLNLIFTGGLVSTKIFKSFLDHYFGNKTMKDVPNLYIVSTEFSEGKKTIFCADETPNVKIVDAIRASAAMPLFFSTVKIDKKSYFDGGMVADFYIDYFKGKAIGFKTRNISEQEEKSIVTKIKPIAVMNNALNAMIKAQEEEHIEDAVNAKICWIKLPYSALHFNLTDEEIDKIYKIGYKSAFNKAKSKRFRKMFNE